MKLYSLALIGLLATTAVAQKAAPPAAPAPPKYVSPVSTEDAFAPKKDPPPKPPGDPYVKKKPAAPKPEAAPEGGAGGGAGASAGPDAPFEAPPHHLLMTFETYRLPQAAADGLLDKANTDTSLYEGLRKLVEGGQAALETVIAVPTRSGQRASIESHDEFIYPSEFKPPTPAIQFSFPRSREMRPLGERIEVDPVEGPDGEMVDINFTQDITKLAGFHVVKAGEFSEGELQPVFSSRKLATAVVTKIGEPAFCGTLSPPEATGVEGDDGDGSVCLTFVRTNLCPTSAEAEAAKKNNRASRNIRLVFRFYSLPREKAREFLAETTDSEKLHAKVTGLPPQDVKLERLLTVITRSGQRSQTVETTEWLYGIETDPPQAWNEEKTEFNEAGAEVKSAPKPASPPVEGRPPYVPAGTTSFETQPLGWQMELDPVVAPGGLTIDVNLAPSYVQYRGLIQGHPLLARYPDMPLFSSQKIYTAITATLGKQCFLGTMSPPRDTGANGRKDDGRTWFGFMKATIE
ncbi:hypothetical protein DES53_12412 [Roseimicrobium gellanilyticum]|uniref:Uncharacterized protein n=1 Tax=Roseimicrobium gellanilyticum TaxID=748857 RepID=A0A366H058_9BACT|nr:hypothetical protein [Roseimicrobium gellanilyticum]RBP35212.1 hypothetical protein DES53_12412 [Roseimicrobium gellanilyticum]